eukprot:1791182-Pleurochrysis_carterae.AAC.1
MCLDVGGSAAGVSRDASCNECPSVRGQGRRKASARGVHDRQIGRCRRRRQRRSAFGMFCRP